MKAKFMNVLAVTVATLMLSSVAVPVKAADVAGSSIKADNVIGCILSGNGVAYCARQAWGN